MSVPAPREPRHGSTRWDAEISALDDWPRTLRFCLIRLVMVSVVLHAAAVVGELIKHVRW
jgi:hypothetical protein